MLARGHDPRPGTATRGSAGAAAPPRALTRRTRASGALPRRTASPTSSTRRSTAAGASVPARWGEPDPVGADARLDAALSRGPTPGAGAGRTAGRSSGSTATRRSWRDARLRARAARAATAAVRLAPGGAVSLPLPPEPSVALARLPTRRRRRAATWRARAGARLLARDRRGAAALVRALTRAAQRGRRAVPAQGRRPPVRATTAATPRCSTCRAPFPGAAPRRWSRSRTRAARVAATRDPGVHACAGAGRRAGRGPRRTRASFGERRCGLLAEAIVRRAATGSRTRVARRAVVADGFARAGVDARRALPRALALAGRHVL